ncbi:MAG: class I SAM-dependent methyltransferase [Thermoanaerobaculia bacterium]
MIEDRAVERYYDRVWTEKLSLPQYGDLGSRWRSRWTFAADCIAPGSQVLDAGCGDGVFGEMLMRQKGCRVTGLEISGYARERARKRGVEALPCDISEQVFPVPEASFDAVTMLCCLEHIFDPGHALRQASRAIRPGGKVLVTLPNAVQLRFRLAFLRGRLSKDLLHTNDGEGLHIRFFDYARDFDELVASQAPRLRLVEKRAELKNPRAAGPLQRSLLGLGMRLLPNLFAEYSHYVLVKGELPPP